MSNNLNTTNQSVEHQNIEWKQEWKNDNRLTLWNAGKLPDELTIEQLFKVHESIPRNPLLAAVCYKTGYIDSWGRGVEKISDACPDEKLPAPLFIERSGKIVVELNRSSVESSVKSLVKVGENSEETLDKKRVETRVKTPDVIVVLLREKPNLTLAEIATHIGKDVSTVERAIAKLKSDNIILRIGSTKGGYWEIIDE